MYIIHQYIIVCFIPPSSVDSIHLVDCLQFVESCQFDDSIKFVESDQFGDPIQWRTQKHEVRIRRAYRLCVCASTVLTIYIYIYIYSF